MKPKKQKGRAEMFAIGSAEEKVTGTKLRVPKEYNLNKKGRKIYGLWLGEFTLYLSDEREPLRAKGGKSGMIFDVKVHTESTIEVPRSLDGRTALITGRISAIKIQFQ
jgi:hypothetical protein